MITKNFHRGMVDMEKIKNSVDSRYPSGKRVQFYHKVSRETGINIQDSFRQVYCKTKNCKGFSVPVLYAISKGLNCKMEDLIIK